jgi:hypothetical protein
MSKRLTLAGTTPLVDPAALDRTLRPALAVHKMVEQSAAVQDALLPRGIRQMLDMQASLGRFANPFGAMDRLHEKLARATDPFGLAKFSSFGHIGAIDRSSSAFALSDSLRAVTGALQMQRDLLGTSKLFELAKGLEAVVGRSAMHDSLAPFMKLDRALGSALETETYARWQSEFTKTVAPSLGLLGMEWQHPVGVLATLATPELGASMSWTADETSAVAALLPQEAARSEITIEVSITCAFCGHDMIADQRRFRWKGNRKGLLDLSIVPICTECQHRSNEDPTYLSRALRELEGPMLRVVTSNGTSDGVPRGKLRLVQDDRDREDD